MHKTEAPAKYLCRKTSLVLTYISFRQDTSPRRRTPPLRQTLPPSPTRRTRPFCRYRDISPVSAGEFTPKEEEKEHSGGIFR